jgi:predicted protein tyrosine phosphatase
MKAFIVSSVYEAFQNFTLHEATHAVSFRDHSFEFPALEVDEEKWLRHYMYDRYFDPGTVESESIREFTGRLIDWVRALPEDAVVQFNCQMGISRSTAACLIACVVRYGFQEGSARFFNEVGRRGCAPNQVLLEHADAQLGLGGRLAEFGESVYTYYTSMYENALVPHRKSGVAPRHDPWDQQ